MEHCEYDADIHSSGYPESKLENVRLSGPLEKPTPTLPRLSMDEIRKNLRTADQTLSGRKNSTRSTIGYSELKDTDKVEEHHQNSRMCHKATRNESDGLHQHKTIRPPNGADEIQQSTSTPTLAEKRNAIQTLSLLCEEILVYCSLMDSSRIRAIEEGIKHQKTLRHLEDFLQAASQRDADHLAQVDHLRQMQATLDQKYRTIKTRAKQLIRSCQESRDRHQSELNTTTAMLQSLEPELLSLQTTATSQRKELERAKETDLNLKSPRDVAEIGLRLRKLQSDNANLKEENACLSAQYTDLLLQAQKVKDVDKGSSVRRETILLLEKRNQLQKSLKAAEDEAKRAAEEDSQTLEQLRCDAAKYKARARDLLKDFDELEKGNA